MDIDEIGLDAEGHLFVRPVLTRSEGFEYIYLAAHGVRWNGKSGTLHAAEPERWGAFRLYKQIIADAKDEYGVNLTLTPRTVWSGIPEALRGSIQTEHGSEQSKNT